MLDPEVFAKSFQTELRLAKLGQPSRLNYIVHDWNKFAAEGLVLPEFDNKTLEVIVGGTNYQVKTAGQILEKGELPINTNLSYLAKIIEANLIPQISEIFLNFAYPLAPVVRGGRLDGQVGETKKEKFTDLLGKMVGAELEVILNNNDRKVRVTVVNDMIAMLLKAATNNSAMIAMVVGTGFNIGFSVDQKAVSIEPSDKFANLEPNIGGKSLLQRFNKNFPDRQLTTGDQLSELAEQYAKNIQNPETEFADFLLKRSAKYTAMTVTALIPEVAKNDTETIPLIVEGSLFWEGFGYQEYFLRKFEQYSDYKIILVRAV